MLAASVEHVIVRHVDLRDDERQDVQINPFRIGERVRGAWFIDRADEVRTVTRAMTDRGRLLLWRPRRMGKSTILGVAAERVRADWCWRWTWRRSHR